jgi:hypothetical protein
MLWFKSGRADCLGVVTYDERFPEDHQELGNFTLSDDPSAIDGSSGGLESTS